MEGRQGQEKQGSGPKAGQGERNPWILRGILIGIVAVVVLVVAVSGGDDEGDTVAEEVPPRLVTTAELQEAAEDSEFPIYWAGEMAGTKLELTQGSDGSALVRYLAQNLAVGEGNAESLSIGTYPLDDPEAALANAANNEGSILRDVNDRQLLTNQANRDSVYFVDPDNTVQVEVYDPSPQRAWRLAGSPRVQPVE